jgi:hypothetical protein
MSRSFSLLPVFLFLIFSACKAQNNLPLQLTLKKQNSLQYNVNIEELVDYKADKESSNVKSITSFKTVLTPVSVKKDSIKMTSKIKEIHAKISGLPDGQKDIDTAVKFSDNQKSIINFQLGANGKYTGLKQTEFHNEGLPYLPYFTQFLASIFLELPAGKININDSWKSVRVDTIRQGLSKLIINMPLNYTYQSNKDTLGFNCAEVIFRSTAFDISLQDELMKIFNIEYTLEGEGLINGRMLIDRATGKTIKLDQFSLTSYTLGIITPNQVKNIIPVKTTQHLKADLIK